MSAPVTDPPLTKKPEDTPFKQQRLPAWQPILTPFWVIVTFFIIGVVFLPLGIVIYQASNDVVEVSHQYDGAGMTGDCALTDADETKTCTVSLSVEKKMTAPIYVYYQLDNFYQNHRRYVKSRSNDQLNGEFPSTSDLESDCAPLDQYNDGGTTKYLNPCGLIANSYFNDVFEVTGYDMTETGIAWETDVEYRYSQPEGFCYAETSETTVTNCETTLTSDSSCPSSLSTTTGTIDIDTTTSSSTNYCYYYPDTDSYYYLYQRYPQISPIKGVTDEHFIVWMRTAALPDFRKLYGIINTDIEAGTTLTIDIDSNFYVQGFEGSKSIVLSTTSWFGGANLFLGNSYIVVGSVCLFLAVVFLAKQLTCPRKLGDTRYLGWKEA